MTQVIRANPRCPAGFSDRQCGMAVELVTFCVGMLLLRVGIHRMYVGKKTAHVRPLRYFCRGPDVYDSHH